MTFSTTRHTSHQTSHEDFRQGQLAADLGGPERRLSAVPSASTTACCAHRCAATTGPAVASVTDVRGVRVPADSAGVFSFRGQHPSRAPLTGTSTSARRPTNADPADGGVPPHASGASPLRLARMPRQQPTVAPPATARADDVTVDGVPILGRVVELARRFGVELEDVARAARDPEAAWPGLNGVSEVRLRGEIAAIVPDDAFEVIAIATRRKALEERSQPRHGAVKRGSSTMGRRHPTSVADLLAAVHEAGFTVARDSRHLIIRHPDLPGQVTAAATPSDPRSIPNTVMQVRRTFGIDLRHGTPQSA